MKSIRLGVNVDHVATLRQVRGGNTTYPDLLENVLAAVRGGADQITIHLREDRRHIQDKDLVVLAAKCPVDLNLEMAATDEMKRLALKHRPKYVCLVPEKRRELTTEGGLDVVRSGRRITGIVSDLLRKGIGVSPFIAPDLKQVRESARVGAFAVEFHTGHWVLAKGRRRETIWKRLVESAEEAHRLGLRVHAGHGLDWASATEIARLPHLAELNIGHSIVCHALLLGMEASVQRMKQAIERGTP